MRENIITYKDSKWTCKNNLLESKLEWKKKFEGQYEWVEVQNFVTRNLIHLKPENPDYPVPGTSMFGVASAFMEKDRISEGVKILSSLYGYKISLNRDVVSLIFSAFLEPTEIQLGVPVTLSHDITKEYEAHEINKRSQEFQTLLQAVYSELKTVKGTEGLFRVFFNEDGYKKIDIWNFISSLVECKIQLNNKDYQKVVFSARVELQKLLIDSLAEDLAIKIHEPSKSIIGKLLSQNSYATMNVTRIKEPLTLLRKYVETYHVAINSSKQSLVNGNFSMILQAFGKLIDCLSVLSITKVINADTLVSGVYDCLKNTDFGSKIDLLQYIDSNYFKEKYINFELFMNFKFKNADGEVDTATKSEATGTRKAAPELHLNEAKLSDSRRRVHSNGKNPNQTISTKHTSMLARSKAFVYVAPSISTLLTLNYPVTNHKILAILRYLNIDVSHLHLPCDYKSLLTAYMYLTLLISHFVNSHIIYTSAPITFGPLFSQGVYTPTQKHTKHTENSDKQSAYQDSSIKHNVNVSISDKTYQPVVEKMQDPNDSKVDFYKSLKTELLSFYNQILGNLTDVLEGEVSKQDTEIHSIFLEGISRITSILSSDIETIARVLKG